MNLTKKKLFKKTTAENANTQDILYSLTAAVPAAIKQAIELNLPAIVGINQETTPIDAGILTGQWIRNNVKYKIDPFNEQNIQLPSSLLRTKKGDCKSLSLLFLSIMEAAGFNAGFRFVSYKKGRPYTHVYNFICLFKNKFHTFDCCIKNLVENQNYKSSKDMKVNYLAGTPVMMGEDMEAINKPSVYELMQDDRYMSLSGPDYIGRKKIFKNLGKNITRNIKGVVKNVKGVALAPARGPFLLLVDANFNGIARKLDEARKKDPKLYEEFWLKLGGKVSSLNKAVDKGRNKKPKRTGINGATDAVYLGGPDSICYVGEGEGGGDAKSGINPADVLKAVGAAGPIIAALQKLFKKLFVKDKPEDGEKPEIENDKINPEGGDFAASDPASEEAEVYAKTGRLPKFSKGTPGENVSFKPSPVMIAAGVAAVGLAAYLLTKKKSKK